VKRVVRVALDVPLSHAFDYRLEEACTEDIGCLTIVPFGRRTAVGVIIDLPHIADVEPARLRTVSRVVRNVPRLEPGDLKLLRFASDYYQYPLGQAVLGSLPLRT